MTDFFIGDRVSAYGTWQGPGPNSSPPQPNGQALRFYDVFDDRPPDQRWDRSMRMKRFQGDVSQWIQGDAGSLSRAQAQGPGVHPMNALRYTEFWMKLNSLASWASDDFHMCWEIHTPSANPGGVTTLNLRTGPQQSMFRQWVGPGSFTHAYRGRATIVIGEWHHYIIGFRPATAATGYFGCWRDGVLQYEQSGYVSTTQSGTHYPEIGFYTYWGATGTDDMNIAGLRVTDVFPTYPGGGGSNPPPPPPPAAPTVAITTPTAGQTYIGTLPYSIDLTDVPAGSTLYAGLGSSGIFDQVTPAAGNSTRTGSLNLATIPAAGRTDGFYGALHGSNGAQLAQASVNVAVFPSATTPPPPPDPVPGSLAVASASSVTIGGRLVDPDVVVPLSRVEWAEFDFPREYQVRRARELGTGRWLKYDSGAGGLIYDPDAVSPLEQ